MKRDQIERLLPSVFQRALPVGGPLSALLDVMDALHEPSEQVLTDIDAVFSPYRTPDRFVPFLASWVDLDRFFPANASDISAHDSAGGPISTGLGRLRELIAAAAQLSQWRGTAKGLQLFLETATGVRGFELDEDVLDATGSRCVFHFRIRAPETTACHRVLLERIVNQEKPAYVTYELEFGPTGQGGN